MSRIPLEPADLRGLAMLATTATIEVDRIVEAMQGNFATPIPAIPKVVHGSIQRVASGVGWVTANALRPLTPTPTPHASHPRREALIAAVNGVIGDHLHDTSNPLAIQPSIRFGGRPVDPPRGHVVVGVHGLCMNDLQFTRAGTNHVTALAEALGLPAVFVHYNSGRSVHDNGAVLAELLAGFDQVTVVAHSLGGLVTRAALAQGLGNVRRVACLATPHHGAPLERQGNWLEAFLGKAPYAGPLARLGQLRSAAITDLRYGHVTAAPAQRFAPGPDSRPTTTLPENVEFLAVAADKGKGFDGLVQVPSALGDHPTHSLNIDSRLVIEGGHMDVLSHPDVTSRLIEWARE